ncbi:MAG: YdcF family protein [Vicinamibacterales bacterium]
MADAAWYVFSSGGVVSLLGAAALWLALRPHSRPARGAVAALVCFYVIVSTWAITHRATAALGAGFVPLKAEDVPPGTTAIVVLGSGSFTARDWDDGSLSIVDAWAAMRVLEAARVFRLANPEWIVSSGGLVHPEDDVESTGVTMRDALVRLGVPSDRILSNLQSFNTAAEAANVTPLLRRLEVDHTILVTSRFHMRRSIGAFRAQGVEVIPAIARDPASPRSWITRWLPSELGLYEGALAAHEILGIAYYRWRGWYR